MLPLPITAASLPLYPLIPPCPSHAPLTHSLTRRSFPGVYTPCRQRPQPYPFPGNGECQKGVKRRMDCRRTIHPMLNSRKDALRALHNAQNPKLSNQTSGPLYFLPCPSDKRQCREGWWSSCWFGRRDVVRHSCRGSDGKQLKKNTQKLARSVVHPMYPSPMLSQT